MRRAWLVAFAVAGAAALLFLGRRSAPPPAVIARSVAAVDGFELRHKGFGDELLFPGNFSLGYALWANYPYVVYRDEVYRRAGPGSVFVRPAQGLQPRYLVEERIAPAELRQFDPETELVVSERGSGEVLGHRGLRMGRSEDGHGWAGQHGAEFLRKVLLTEAPIGGAVGVVPYGAATATIETLDGEVAPPVERTGADCPAAYRIDHQRPHSALDTGAWAFIPQMHANSFACHGDAILVQSGYGNWLHLDLVTASGKHVFQTELRTPVGRHATIAVRRVRVTDTQMQADIVYGASREADGRTAPIQLLRATIALPAAAARAPTAKLAVK